MTWLQVSSPNLPFNLGMSKGSLVSIADQVASWKMGSLVGLVKSKRFKLSIRGILGMVNEWEPTITMGCSCEVIMECNTKCEAFELDPLGLLGGGLVG